VGRKKKSELIIDEQGQAWDPDDFFLDSHGVKAPLRDRRETGVVVIDPSQTRSIESDLP
jgi:hypothetical protein